MRKFRKDGKKGMPAISTASLPDIVFMLLFFFMVTTVMRETTLFVSVTTPKATEIKKLKKKSLSNYKVNYTSLDIYRFNDFFVVQVFVQIFIILDNCFYHGFINI